MFVNSKVVKKLRCEFKKKKTKIACAYLCGLLLTSQITSCSCRRTMVERERELRASMTQEYEERIDYIVSFYESKIGDKALEDSIEEDAKDIARVIYGFHGYKISQEGKKIVADVILNRVKCSTSNFGDTVHDVCTKEGQWISFGEFYLEEDFKLAKERLVSGGSLIPSDCYWISVTDGKISARNNFVEAAATTIYSA